MIILCCSSKFGKCSKFRKFWDLPRPHLYLYFHSSFFWNSEIYGTITFVDSCSKCVQESENIYIVDDSESSFWCNWGRKYNFQSNFSTNITILLPEINPPRVFQCRWFVNIGLKCVWIRVFIHLYDY